MGFTTCFDQASGCTRERDCWVREREGKKVTVHIWRGSPGQHLFRLVWAVLVVDPGWSGGWSVLVCEPVRLGKSAESARRVRVTNAADAYVTAVLYTRVVVIAGGAGPMGSAVHYTTMIFLNQLEINQK